MKQVNTHPLSGMQELTPSLQHVFDAIKARIAAVYKAYGFIHIETPFIERSEVLLSKAGGDTEQQIYFLSKTGSEDATRKSGEAKRPSEALRFDHTVPLARYVAEHQNDLDFPFAVTQINRNFRGERAQRGRFREFYQCDVDVIGSGDLPLAYDAQVIATIVAALRTFLHQTMTVRLSNRKVLAGFLFFLGLSDKTKLISNVIDHAEKVSPAETRAALKELGLDDAICEKLLRFMNIKGTAADLIAGIGDILGIDLSRLLPLSSSLMDHSKNPAKTVMAQEADSVDEDSRAKLSLLLSGLQELQETTDILASLSPDANILIDLLIVRGLDYYTGNVFEIVLDDYRKIGSIAGGGRYENLTGHFTRQAFPGVGCSIGLTRLFFVLNDAKLLPKDITYKNLDLCILPLAPKKAATTNTSQKTASLKSDQAELSCLHAANQLALKLRKLGFSVDVDFSTRKLSARLQRAENLARFALVLGEDEVTSGQAQVKNFSGDDFCLQLEKPDPKLFK